MRHEYRSDTVPPSLEHVPLKARLAVAEKMREADLSRTRAAARHARSNARIKRKGQKGLERIMGTSRRERYIEQPTKSGDAPAKEFVKPTAE